jgi:hypothetical protein
MNKFGEARHWLEKARQLSKEAGLPVSDRQLETLNALAVALMAERPAEAETVLREASDLIRCFAGQCRQPSCQWCS